MDRPLESGVRTRMAGMPTFTAPSTSAAGLYSCRPHRLGSARDLKSMAERGRMGLLMAGDC